MKKTAILTLNPGVDRIVYLNDAALIGGHNRSARTVTCQGSKGANQAILLAELGNTVDYFSFTGGESGRLANSFTERPGIINHFVETKCGVRLNIKVMEPNGRGTEFNECGGPVTDSELSSLLCELKDGKYDIVSLCGSFPQGVENHVYNSLITELKASSCTVVVDASGEPLVLAAAAAPALIKPNRQELGAFGFGVPESIEDATKICGKVKEKFGCDIICTLDQDGSVFVGDEGAFAVKTAPITVKGFSGAGDSYLAAFIHAKYISGIDIASALHFAASAAAAKIELDGTVIPTAEQIRKVRHNTVEVIKI